MAIRIATRDVNPLTKVREHKPDVHLGHPLVNSRNHEFLLEYCKSRLDFALSAQRTLRNRFSVIDRELAGYISLTEDDKKRDRENKAGKPPRPIEQKLPLALSQLRRAVTHFLGVFSPEAGMFEAFADTEKQQLANGVVSLMNEHAEKQSYYTQYARFLLNAFKYNLGGLRVAWDIERGNEIAEDISVGFKVEPNREIWAGNKIWALDPYNTLIDPSVHPTKLATEGEFAAEVDLFTSFRIARMVENGEIFGIDDITSSIPVHTTEAGTESGFNYYFHPPQLRDIVDNTTMADGSYNWHSILAPHTGTSRTEFGSSELVNLYIRLLPAEFGLIPAKEAKERNLFEIWRITIYNGKKIVAAEHMTNAHNMLPFVFTVPYDDHLLLETQTPSEELIPLQTFGSFLLNAHVKATRRNIWNFTIYDPKVIDLALAEKEGTAYVPIATSAMNIDLEKAVKVLSGNVQTDKLLNDLDKIVDLMEHILPTQQLRQVADLERATTFQAAATVQASSKDLHKYSRIIDDQAMKPHRRMLYWNILQFQEAIELLTPDGQRTEIAPSVLRKTDIEFAIGDGLKGIDKIALMATMKEIVLTIIQNTGAAVQFDIPKLANWLASVHGERFDLSQFRLPPEQAPAAAAEENNT